MHGCIGCTLPTEVYLDLTLRILSARYYFMICFLFCMRPKNILRCFHVVYTSNIWSIFSDFTIRIVHILLILLQEWVIFRQNMLMIKVGQVLWPLRSAPVPNFKPSTPAGLQHAQVKKSLYNMFFCTYMVCKYT